MPGPRLRVVPTPRPSSERFVKMDTSDQGLEAFRRIITGPRPFQTLKVWHAVCLTLEHERPDVRMYADELAGMTGLTPNEASRAMSQLARHEILIRLKRGRYRINAFLAWNGSSAAQRTAQQHQPHLQLVPTAPDRPRAS